MILQAVHVPADVYVRRTQEERSVWEQKQQMARSPHSLLRAQAMLVNSPFTDMQMRINKFRDRLLFKQG